MKVQIRHFFYYSLLAIPCAAILSGALMFSISRGQGVVSANRQVVEIPVAPVAPLTGVRLPDVGYNTQRITTVTLRAVGDLMFSRSVASKIREHDGDVAYPLSEMAPRLEDADITFGNLETVVMAGRVIKSGEMVFRSDPEVAGTLADAGIDIVSLANNHSMNFGVKGMVATLDHLHDANIMVVGGGLNDVEARTPKIIKVRGLRFAFLGYVDNRFTPSVYEAQTDQAGVAFARVADIITDVTAAREMADVVVVSLHAGTEYQSKSDAVQKRLARAAIDAGATLVIGHHPHVVEEVERYKDGLIIYSLGNFVFDQMWSADTRRGALAEITFGRDGWNQARFLPIEIFDYAQPRAASAVAARAIKSRLGVPLKDDADGWWVLQK